MRSTFRFAASLTAWLALVTPAGAQQQTSGAGPDDMSSAPKATAVDEKAATSEAADPDSAWKKGRPITMQYFRPQDKRGINVFETSKVPGAEYTGFKLDFGAGFTSQVQYLSHSNTAAPNVVSGVNTNQLADIGFGFNNSTANLYLNAQLAPGIRVALTSYLSSRHHNETWVKDGYIQIDQSPIDFAPLKALMEIVTVRVGHMEINYGDAHFRRSDNGNAIYNPFVGNYIMDAFTTEIGGEVYLKASSIMAMGADHRRRAARHGAHARAARPGLHRQARIRPPGEQRPAGAADRLDVQSQQSHEQHALRRRPRRLALLLRDGEHDGDGIGADVLRPASIPASRIK